MKRRGEEEGKERRMRRNIERTGKERVNKQL